MAYDEDLAERVRLQLRSHQGVIERKMFGGVGFLLHGNMCVGIWKDALVVRLARERHEQTLEHPHAQPFDVTGKVMRGWALIEPEGLESPAELGRWIDRAVRYVSSLPAK